ncbi:UNVERIFIED_CONTAM: hypothetical protein FKN15_025045 [Acipenser sinensis]
MEEFEMEKHKLKDQLLQMEKLVTKLEAVSGEGRTHRAQLQGLTEENSALKVKLAMFQQEVQKLEVDVNRQRKQTEQRKSEQEKEQSEVELLFKENTRYRNEVFEISTRNLQLSSENADLNSKLKADQSTIQLLNERLAQISLQKEEEAVVTRQLQEASGRLEREQLQQQSGWQRDKELMEKELQISKEKGLTEENSALKVKLAMFQQEVQKLEVDVNRQRKQTEQRKSEQEKEQSEVELLFKENTRYRNEVFEISTRNLQLSSENADLNSKLKADQSTIQLLNERLAQISLQKEEEAVVTRQLQEASGRLEREQLQQQSGWQRDKELMEQELQISKEKLQRLKEVESEFSSLTLKHQWLEQDKECLVKELEERNAKFELIHAQESELQRVNQECQTLRRKQTQLEAEMVEAQDQLLEASMTLTLAQSQHVREVQQLKEQTGEAVPRDQVAQLQSRLAEEQHKGQWLQEQINAQAEQASKQMALKQEQYEQVLKQMEERMEEVEAKLKTLRMILQEKVNQLKEQLAKNAKSDVLLKDLYVENSQLMKALQVTEQRQKSSEKKNFILEEKIAALNKLLCKITPASLTA